MGETMTIQNAMRCTMLGLMLLAGCVALLPSGAQAETDRHAGYY